MEDIFRSVLNGQITAAWDDVESIISSQKSLRVSPEVLAQLEKAKDALFQARVLTDGHND